MVNTLTPRRVPLTQVNTLTPRRVSLTQVNTLAPRKKTKTKEEIAKEARAKRSKKIQAKRNAPGSKFRKVRPSVLKPPKTKKSKKPAPKKQEEDDLDDFIVDDSDEEMLYLEPTASDDEEDDGGERDLDELDEFKGKSLAEKEKLLKKRQEQRKGNIDALIERLEAQARKKAKKDGLSLPSEEAFVKKTIDCCPKLKKLEAELAEVKKQLAECRSKSCKKRKPASKKTKSVAMPAPTKTVSDANRKARIEKIKAKRSRDLMKRPVRKPTKPRARKPRPVKECKTGYTRDPKSRRCKKDAVEKEDSEKVKFAKWLIDFDKTVLLRQKGGSDIPAKIPAKKLREKIDSYFKANLAASKKQRLQNKEQSEAFNAAREIYYLNNPAARPKRKRSTKK